MTAVMNVKFAYEGRESGSFSKNTLYQVGGGGLFNWFKIVQLE